MCIYVCGIAKQSCQTGWVTLEWSWASITLRLCKKGIIKCEAASKGGKGVNVRVWGVGGVEWGKRGSDLNHHTPVQRRGSGDLAKSHPDRVEASEMHLRSLYAALPLLGRLRSVRKGKSCCWWNYESTPSWKGDGRENWASNRIL